MPRVGSELDDRQNLLPSWICTTEVERLSLFLCQIFVQMEREDLARRSFVAREMGSVDIKVGQVTRLWREQYDDPVTPVSLCLRAVFIPAFWLPRKISILPVEGWIMPPALPCIVECSIRSELSLERLRWLRPAYQLPFRPRMRNFDVLQA